MLFFTNLMSQHHIFSFFHKFSTIVLKIGGLDPFHKGVSHVTMKWGEVGRSGERDRFLGASVRWVGSRPSIQDKGRVLNIEPGQGATADTCFSLSVGALFYNAILKKVKGEQHWRRCFLANTSIQLTRKGAWQFLRNTAFTWAKELL